MNSDLVEGSKSEAISSGRSGAIATPGVFGTTRIRHTNHDGMAYDTPGLRVSGTTFSSTTREVSGSIGAYVGLPSVAGVKVQVGGFLGTGALDIELKDNTGNRSLTGDPGDARGTTFIYGGYALFSQDTLYAMVSVTGANGESKIRDNSQVLATEFSYDTRGVIGMFDVGNRFTAGTYGSNQVFLDLRGGVLTSRFEGGSYFDQNARSTVNSEMRTVIGSLSAELYTSMALAGGATLVPFVKASYRHFFTNDNEIYFVEAGATGKVKQSDDRGLIEGGAKYIAIPDKLSFSGSAYYEGASDQDTFGARLGASFKLN